MSRVLEAICDNDGFEALKNRAWTSLQRALECVWGEDRIFRLAPGELEAFLRCWLPYQAQRILEDYSRVHYKTVLYAHTDEATGGFGDVYFCLRTHLSVHLVVTPERLSGERRNLRWHWWIDLHLPAPVAEELPELNEEFGEITKVDDTHFIIDSPEFARVRVQVVKDALSESASPRS